MENECLITTLKGIVDNDNLPVFGEVIIENVNNTFGADGVTFIVTPKSGSVQIDNVTITEKTNFTGEKIINASSGKFAIKSYYDLKKGTIDAEHFSYVTAPTSFSVLGDYSKFVSISKPTLTRISFGTTSTASNHVEALRILQNTPNVNYIESHNLSFTATMIKLGQAIPLTCTEWWVPFDVSTITGTWEDFVTAMRARQAATGIPQTGSIQIQDVKLPNVTFNGKAHGWQSTTLSWTETTITCYGETITA